VHLAVFGKHPGWDDHIEEIGLDTPELVTARRLLYSEGVAGNIDSGAWDRLEEGKLLPAFKHNFFWRIGGQWIVGRMWSSRDGKGRSKYPMVVCGRIDGASAALAARSIIPALLRFEDAVKSTTLADGVKQAASQARSELSQASAAVRSDDNEDADLLRRLVDHPNLMPGGDPTIAFERVMYEIEREMQGFRRQSAIARSKQEPSGQHMRVPRCFEAPGEDARAWTALLDRNIDRATGVLVVEPDDADFVDVLVGAPAVGHIFCLRATRTGLGLATDVPYTIDPDFAAIVRAKRESYRKNENEAQAKRSAPIASESKPGSSNMKWFVLAGVGLISIVGGVVLLSGGGGKTPTAPTEPEKVETEQPKVKSPEPAAPKPTKPVAQAEVPVDPPKSATKPEVEPVVPSPQQTTQAPKTPRTFDPADPRANWSAPARLDDIVAQLDARADVLATDAPREAAAMRELMRNAREILDDALAIEYPSGRIAIEFTVKKLDEKMPELQQAQAAIEQKIIDSAKAVKGAPQLKIDVMSRAWRSWFESLDFTKGSKVISEQVDAAAAAFLAIERELSRATNAQAASLQVDVDPIRARIADEASRLAMRGEFDEALTQARVFATQIQTVDSLIEKAVRLRAMLQSGVLPGEVVDGLTVEQAAAQVRSSPALASMPGACADLLDRADKLSAIAGETETNKILQNIKTEGSYSIAAMIRLGSSDIKLSAAQLLEASAAYAGPVKNSLAAITDSEAADSAATRRARVTDRVSQAARACWSNAVESLGSDEAGLHALEASANNFGVELWTTASARVKFNRALALLRASGPERSGDAALDVLARGAELSAADRETVKSTLDRLASLKPVQKAPEFSQIGPAQAGWKLVESDESRAVYEKGSRGGVPVRLEFRSITGASGAKSMVLTTEVSVRMAAVMASDANAITSKTASLIGWRFLGESTDSRSGPRTWTWSGTEQAQELLPVAAVGLAQGWLRGEHGWIGSSLPVSNPKPSWDSPMQYIGLPGALLLARAAGCVLPTVEEYTLALQASGADQASNVRDSSWSGLVGAWLAVNADTTKTCPANADSFAGAVSGGSTPALAQSKSDGVVWFDRVDAGAGVFRNLVGNVAEYVAADANAMQTLASTQVELLSRVREAPVMVIGASALSGPEVVASVGVPMKQFSSRGYSDVGFRLAFALQEAQGPMEWDTEAVKQAAAGAMYVVQPK
jgi:outer membrane biosynthesis protein TonB